jgi:hypothetical protein
LKTEHAKDGEKKISVLSFLAFPGLQAYFSVGIFETAVHEPGNRNFVSE